MSKTSGWVWVTALAVLALAASTSEVRAAKKGGPVCATVEEARKAGPDFDIQGEYDGTAGGKKIGVQVIALGEGHFEAVFLPGGLPGAGWDGKSKILCQGKLEGGTVALTPSKGGKKYMGGPPEEFRATQAFPPEGQKAYTATLADGKLRGKTDTGEAIEAAKVERKSPTLGARPPEGAEVLLAYEPGKPPSLDAWTNPKWQPKPEGHMQVVPRARTNRTKKTFAGAWTLHVEFRTPFLPTARGQGRGNSGVFPPAGREIQVLDSFGLEGLGNECGGIYRGHRPKVNMCLPPLSWQTFDVTYQPQADAKPATYTIRHNGVVIHDKLSLGRGRTGALSLQDHGNPVAYRNIWIAVKPSQ